jgi:DNA primase
MDAVEEVKSRLSIEDVIAEYVQLKRAGRNWRGLSPFSNEKTPSFMVSPEKQIWHDFSSGKGGNMFSFVMEVEGLEFKGALELLARKAGIDIDQYRSTPRAGGPNKERLYELLELATKFYQVQFSKNKMVLEYVLQQRQFTKETALEWRLGYSPNNGSALLDYAKSKGFTEPELKQAGLSAQSYRGGIQDMFRGRLMIPLQDAQGRLIGFTARQLDDDPNAPKYINTPQTVLYDKSRHVYGLHLAKESIRKSKFVVLVEGNLDVIASHQAGVRQVVATAGTALTEPHLKVLSRFTGDIRLCFDADKAGIAATERALPIAARVKVSLSVIDIPSGKDPDDLIRQNPKLWEEAIMKHQYALDWLMARHAGLLDINSAQGKREFSDVLLPVVRGLADAVERDHYLNAIAKIIDVSREALEQKFQKTTGLHGPNSPDAPVRRRRLKVEPEKLNKRAVENQKTQDNFLSLMLMRLTLREFLSLVTPEMLYTDNGRALLDFLQKNPDFDGKNAEKLSQALHSSTMQGAGEQRNGAVPEGTAERAAEAATPQGAESSNEIGGLAGNSVTTVQSLGDYVKIEALLYEELYQGLELNELHDEAARLQARLVENFVKSQKMKLAQELETADPTATLDLLGQSKKYDALLNQVLNQTK